MIKKLLFAVLFFALTACAVPDHLPTAKLPIDSYVKVSFFDISGYEVGSGSGVVVDNAVASAEVLTAAHVCDAPTDVKMLVLDRFGRQYEADILAADYEVDLCLLKVWGLTNPAVKLTNRHMEVGERVYSISSPHGFGSFEDGMVPVIEGTYIGHYTPPQVDRFVGEDKKWETFALPVAPGSSGGMIVNTRGELVSITNRGWRYYTGYMYISAGVATRDVYKFLWQL